MKKYLFITLIAISISLYSSCSINGSLQGLYGYYDKTNTENPNLLIYSNKFKLCELVKTEVPKVYISNGLDLKNCIKNNENSIVYIWGPKCKSKMCIPLELVQQKCDLKKIELYIVAEYYDTKLMEINYKIKRPIFGIDTKYYNSNLTSKYLSKFIFDLTEKNNIVDKYLYFKKEKFVNAYSTIDEIKN